VQLGVLGVVAPLVDDQGAAEEFAADGADEAFGDRVGPRCLHRRLNYGVNEALKDSAGAAVGVEYRIVGQRVEDLITIFTASSLNSGVNFLRRSRIDHPPFRAGP
jgi:hypothetical protein